MNELPSNSTEQQEVPDEVCTFHFTITSEDVEEDLHLYDAFKREDKRLKDQIEELVREHLGKSFHVGDMSIDRGSVDVVFHVIGVAYELISKFKNFRDSLNILSSYVQDFLSDFAARRSVKPTAVKGEWMPSPALRGLAATLGGMPKWYQRVWDGLLGAESDLTNWGLLLAQVAFTVVSWVTTYKGFLLLLDNTASAMLAALGIQSLVFWLPRRLHSQTWRKLALDIVFFIFAMTISVIFSYQAFVDILVPEQLREQKSTDEAFASVEGLLNKPMSVLDATVTRTEERVKEYEQKADRELKEGGTDPDAPSGPGRGRIFNQWQSQKEAESGRLQALMGLRNQAIAYYNTIHNLEGQQQLDPLQKRSDLKLNGNRILTLAQNRQVLDVLSETDAGKNLALEVQRLSLPPIDTGEPSTGSTAVKERFMKGLATVKEAFDDLLAKKELETFHAGAIVALLVAAILDFLILIAGVASSARRVPVSHRKLVTLLLKNLSLKIVRREDKLGLWIQRDANGMAIRLTRSQDIAAQVLLEGNYLKLEMGQTQSGSNVRDEILIITDKNILPYLIEE